MKAFTFLSMLLYLIFPSSCNKDTHPEKTFLTVKEQQKLFAQLTDDETFKQFKRTTIALTLEMFKTSRELSGNIDTVKLWNNGSSFSERLGSAGVRNPQAIIDLSNEQIRLMTQLMKKYPLIKKVPIVNWNNFIEKENKTAMLSVLAKSNNTH